jgi:hypothetical protein
MDLMKPNVRGLARPRDGDIVSPRNGQTSGDFWAITSYFNPSHYQRRLVNYRIFRERLQMPLVAVELAYGPNFELQPEDAEILVQLRGTAVMWQKERLLNVALEALPGTCRLVAWLDCDIFFALPDWAERAQSLLDRFQVVQLFSQVHNFGARWTPGKDFRSEVEFTRPGAVHTLASGVPAAACIGHQLDDRRITCANGFAWGARREFLQQHGFYDACIIGGGDRAMICAAHHCFEELMQRHRMSEPAQQHYASWAKPFYDGARAQVGFLDAEIYHLWHGDTRLRTTRMRHEGLQRFQFDPLTDLTLDENGSWRWNSEKHKMHEYIRDYFASRREDG